MRADRLVAVLLLLQAKGRVTAAEVAEELEVSVRTARRDLEALAMSGVPIYSSRGRGGGWSLIGGARTDLTGLSEGEAQALMVAANVGGAGVSMIGAELSSALRKLVQAMPESFRSGAEVAAGTVHVDPNRWSGPQVGPEPAFLEPLQQAVMKGRQVDLGYRTPNRSPSTRRVHPLGLVTKASVWYLVAETGAGRRTFRVSRVTSVEVTDDAVVRPDDFDLEETWAAIKTDFGTFVTKDDVVAVAVIEPWMMQPLRNLRPARVAVVDHLEDGRLRVEVAAELLAIVAYGFAGLGPGAEVEGPPALLDHLAAIGTDLVRLYSRA